MRKFKDTILPARSTSLSKVPIDDWWWGRLQPYKVTAGVDRFGDFIKNPLGRLAKPPHLVRGDGSANFVYPRDATLVRPPRTHFTTPDSYEQHFIPALLWEREQVVKLQHALYNADVEYPARFLYIDDGQYRMDVKFKPSEMAEAEAKLIPSEETKLSGCIPDLFDTSNPESHFEGKVTADNAVGYDFSVLIRTPQAVLQAGYRLDEQAHHQVNLFWSGTDATAERRLKAIQQAVTLHMAHEPPGPLSVLPDATCGPFTLARIVKDDQGFHHSPPYMRRWQELDVADAEDTQATMDDLVTRLNERQTTFFHGVMNGVRSNVAILEGYPGTGKTHVLAITIICLMLMEKKVLITSQSNDGVTALFDKIISIIENLPGLSHLLAKVVLLRNDRLEEAFAQHLISGEEHNPRFSGAKFWMSNRIEKWCQDHPDAPVVHHYRQHLKGRLQDKKAKASMDWKQTLNILRGKVLDSAYVLGCTTFVAAGLQKELYSATAIFLDEAGQATEPDMLMTVLPHLGELQLLVLTGDVKQLGPVVISDTSNTNPLGSMLATSILLRLMSGWPQIARFPLTKNYRGHIETFNMANEIFYDGVMEVGQPTQHWHTPLASTIFGALSRLTPAFQFPGPSREMRQVSFDVDCLSSKEKDGMSQFNQGGILAVVRLVRFLNDAGVPLGDIGVITMYGEDLRLIVKHLKAAGIRDVETKRQNNENGVRVATVDSFQGKEEPVMIVHFVAAFDYTPGDPFGFVKDPHRLNVATTRAQQYQFLIGNMTHWQSWRAQCTGKDRANHMIKVIDYLQNKKQVVRWASAEAMMTGQSVQWQEED